jgi:hypothetical protein
MVGGLDGGLVSRVQNGYDEFVRLGRVRDYIIASSCGDLWGRENSC